MSAEYLTAIASIATAAIIGATAIAALLQLRHMRSANSISAMLALRAMLDDKRHTRAHDLVLGGAVEKALAEPGCRRYLRAIHGGLEVADEDRHYADLVSEFTMVASVFESIGSMVKHGTVGKLEFLDIYCYTVDTSWRRLEPFIAYVRACAHNSAIGKNFEYLTVLSRDWIENGEPTYPPGMAEIPVRNPYPLDDDE